MNRNEREIFGHIPDRRFEHIDLVASNQSRDILFHMFVSVSFSKLGVEDEVH